MTNFSQIFLHVIFIGSFVFFIILAAILLKPFRLHKRRPKSTAALKISYLLYLVIFLTYVYLLLFYRELDPGIEKGIINFRFSLEYIAFMIAFFVPNIAMLIRRKIRTWRVNYNYIMMAFNLFIVLYLINRIYNTDWSF
jgi:hypothetical protein